jgi:beta-lactamase regulating signal transducer with metallopeptidase domain
MEYLIKVSAILVLFYLCYKFLLQRETFFESNRSFLLLGLITAFILPLITISKHIMVEPNIMKNTFTLEESLLQSQTIVQENPLEFTTIITYLYITGILFFIGRFLLQFGSLVTLLINSTKQRVSSFIYVITKNIISPFSFFNWIVFNPNQFNDTELKQIITHEKVHAKQLHSIDILLAELICILLWFNPSVWYYKRDLRQNLEFIADKNAQATTNCKKSYQHLLLKTSVPNYQMALTNNFYNSSIKKRIVMLHKNKSHNRNQLKFLLVLPVLGLFLMSFNIKEVYIEATSSQAETYAITGESKKVVTSNIETIESKPESKPISKSKKNITNNNVSKSNTVLKQDIVAYFIESSFTEAKLDEVITKLKAHGITLKIKGVKRNNDNEITAIKIDAKTDNSNANFSISNDSAIKTIKITYNAKSNAISIGNTNGLLHDKDYMFTRKDGAITIGKKSGKSGNVFVFSSDEHDGDHEIIEDDDKIIIKKGDKVHEIKKAHKNNNVFTFSSDEGKTYDIIHADSIHSDGKIFKLKGNVIVKGENNGLFVTSEDENIEIKKDEDGNSILIRKDKDGNIVKEKINNQKNNLSFKSKDGKVFKIRSTGKNSNIWIDKDDNNKSTVNILSKGENKIIVKGEANKDVVYIVDGKEVKNKKVKDIDTENIKSISVVKGASATKKYGKKGKDGVVEIITKDNTDATSIIRLSNDSNQKPLIIIDGKEVKNKKLDDIDPNSIESINVLKGESATKKYGKKGKEGVIEITLKKKKN